LTSSSDINFLKLILVLFIFIVYCVLVASDNFLHTNMMMMIMMLMMNIPSTVQYAPLE